MGVQKSRSYRISRSTRLINWPILVLVCPHVFAQNDTVPPEATAVEGPIQTLEAKEATIEFRQFDKIEITGSSIVRREQKTSLPVQIITREDIKRSGYTKLQDVVQNLPVMSNFRDSKSSTSLYNDLAPVVDAFTNATAIHGMRTGTLILLNGKRLASFGIQEIASYELTSPDLAMIPLSAVDRIEILSDGASSLYGTDAIAGVVNIITRTDRKGLEFSAEGIQPDGNRGSGQSLALSWGSGRLARDGFNLQLSAEWKKHAPLVGADRPELGKAYQPWVYNNKTYIVLAPSTYTLGAYTDPASLIGTSIKNPNKSLIWNSSYQNGGCAVGSMTYPGQTACLRNPYWQTDIYPKREDVHLYGLGELALSDGAIAYGELLFHSANESLRAWQWPSYDFLIGPDASYPGYQQALAHGIDPNDWPFALWNPSGLPMLAGGINQQNWRAAVGIKGVWSDWDYHLSAYQSESSASYHKEVIDYPAYKRLSNTWLDNDGYLINPEVLQPTTPNTATGQRLLSLVSKQLVSHGTYRVSGGELRASRTAFEWADREAKLGIGMEVRREATEQVNDAVFATSPAFSNDRSILAGYSELSLPLTPRWEVTGALRHDEYSQVGGTSNSKLSTQWQVTDDLMLRASGGSGFRAPTLGQSAYLDNPYQLGFYSDLPLTCSAELKAIARALHDTNGKPGRCYYLGEMNVFGSGNPDLQPERSQQLSVGMRFTPYPNLSLAVDYWSIRVRDMLQPMPIPAILREPTRYRDFFTLDGAGRLALLTSVVNTGESRRDGIDIDFRVRQPTALGLVLFSTSGTWMTKSQRRLTNDYELASDLGSYSAETDSVTPRLKGRVELSLKNPAWHINLAMNYTGGYVDAPFYAYNTTTSAQRTIRDHQVSPWTTYDLTGGFSVGQNLEFRAGIFNVKNKNPPFSYYGTSQLLFGVNAAIANAWGRVISGQLIQRF